MSTLEEMKANPESRYSVRGYEGVAWRFDDPEIERSVEEVCDLPVGEQCADEQCWNEYCWYEEGERETGKVVMVMVGDDRKFTFDPSDCTKLDDEAYCPECGQIGCMAYR